MSDDNTPETKEGEFRPAPINHYAGPSAEEIDDAHKQATSRIEALKSGNVPRSEITENDASLLAWDHLNNMTPEERLEYQKNAEEMLSKTEEVEADAFVSNINSKVFMRAVDPDGDPGT